MDMSEDHKLEQEKRGGNPVNYHSPGNISSDWPFTNANVTSSSLGLVSTDNQMPICREDLVGASSCSSASMVDSFGPGLWDHSTNSQNLGFYGSIVQIHPNTSNPLEHRKGGPTSLRGGMDKGLEMGWNQPRSMLKGSLFLNGAPGMISQSLSQFPADSAFIERAARFSCFSGGNFSDMMNPFGMAESLGLYTRGGGMMQGPQEVFAASGLKSAAIGQGTGAVETSKDTRMSVEHEAIGGPLRNGRRSESAVKSNDDTRQVVGGTGNESEDVELSGHGGQEEASTLEGSTMELSDKSLGSNKRKRNGQDIGLDQAKENHQSVEAAKGNLEAQQKREQTPSSTPNRNTTGKQGKQGSQASDLQKEEYIHVRARRGQATNSHSLAERVRREKISERMKLLQDLVPGCSKVTGKAVMLDEIINYVQSLQRQVEFLSMKLATVNPRPDFNIEGLLGKDILHSRAVPSSSLAFSPEMPMAYPPFNASQAGLFPAPFPGMESHSDILRRTINSQLTPLSGGFKEPTQVPNAWDDELHNVVQMGYGANTQDGQDVNAGLLPEGGMKAEH